MIAELYSLWSDIVGSDTSDKVWPLRFVAISQSDQRPNKSRDGLHQGILYMGMKAGYNLQAYVLEPIIKQKIHQYFGQAFIQRIKWVQSHEPAQQTSRYLKARSFADASKAVVSKSDKNTPKLPDGLSQDLECALQKLYTCLD